MGALETCDIMHVQCITADRHQCSHWACAVGAESHLSSATTTGMGLGLSPASARPMQDGNPVGAAMPWMEVAAAPAVGSAYPQEAAAGQQEAGQPRAEELDAIMSMLMS